MESWAWAIVFKPLGLLLLFIPGALLVWWIKNKMPDGKLKRFFLIRWKV